MGKSSTQGNFRGKYSNSKRRNSNKVRKQVQPSHKMCTVNSPTLWQRWQEQNGHVVLFILTWWRHESDNCRSTRPFNLASYPKYSGDVMKNTQICHLKKRETTLTVSATLIQSVSQSVVLFFLSFPCKYKCPLSYLQPVYLFGFDT